jgi:MoxR-like ATPase
MHSTDIQALNQKIHAESEVIERLLNETSKVIVGQQYMLERLIIGL